MQTNSTNLASLSLHSPKPTRISKLPTLHPYSPSPTNSTALPARHKTQSSHGDQQQKGRTRSELEMREQQGTSFRLLSRFIYKHLQKKIDFNAQIAKNYPSLSLGVQGNNREEGEAQQSQFSTDTVGHQYERRYRQQCKRGALLRLKRGKRGGGRGVGEGKGAMSIDSYFDLSSL